MPKNNKPSFIVFVSGQTEASARAVANLRAFCAKHAELVDAEIEIVEIAEQPDRAIAERIIATPTTIRQMPPPLRRLIGDLSESAQLEITFIVAPAK